MIKYQNFHILYVAGARNLRSGTLYVSLAVSYTHLSLDLLFLVKIGWGKGVIYQKRFFLSKEMCIRDRLRGRGSLPATFYVLRRAFSMACLLYTSIFYMTNDNCRKFKQNQIIFCILSWIVEFSRPVVFGEDRLRERGSLPATFYVLKGYFLWQTIRVANSNRIKSFFACSPNL